MNVLFYAVGLFIIAFLLHLLIWRVHLPKNHTAALLFIFSAVFISGIFILRLKAPCEYLQLSFLFISLMAAYIANYSAVEADSPTIVMVKAIADGGMKGLDKGAFEERMNNDILVMPRIDDLLRGGFIYSDKGKYKLRPIGFVTAGFFTLFRKILGIQWLGG